ncbi:hypothetical protein SDC9_149243 [bioreactor metagenome]|uniref:Uncharacterized protein n=1 Tax=bioreactor metagenome TaxID=1076179 RepID=A0A645EL25_9ZZZZ
MLQQLRFCNPEVRPFLLGALFVPVPYADRPVPPDPDHQVREGHAVVPEGEGLRAPGDDLGVGDHEGSLPQVQGDEPLRDADLGGGDPPAEAVLLPEELKGLPEILHLLFQQGIGKILHGSAFPPQKRVAEYQDRSFHHHASILWKNLFEQFVVDSAVPFGEAAENDFFNGGIFL